VYVISTASDFIFQGVIRLGAVYRYADIDAGVIQPLPYTVDRQQTIDKLVSFLDRRPQTLSDEINWLKQVQADCVVCDAPFLPW
jgi:L-arabinokinase